MDLFLEYDAKIWTPLFWYDSKNWPLLLIWLKELNSLFIKRTMTQRSELEVFVFSNKNYDSENSTFWFFQKNVTQRIVIFSKKNLGIDHFYGVWLKDFSKYDSQNWTFFQMWLKKIELFLNVTRRIVPYLLCL